MRRGTTPANVFMVDVDLRDAVKLYVTYKQGGKTIIEKTIDDVEITEESVSVELTQADTLKFKNGEVQMQIRARLPDGTALASDIMTASVSAILKDGAI